MWRDHSYFRSHPKGPRRDSMIREHARWENEVFRHRLPPRLAEHFIAEHHSMLGPV
jgi:hypothetical protein